MIARRQLFSLPALFMLTACGVMTTGQPTVTLQQVQSYTDDLIDALSAAAEIYVADPDPIGNQVALVAQIQGDLQTLKVAIDGVQVVSDARTLVVQVVAFVNELVPILTPYLGEAGPLVPVALAVLQAFVELLPLPAAAPATPPPQLRGLAMQYRMTAHSRLH